ncbi:MAG: hypothetical protein KIS63_06745 [Caldilineales bacterium]|nr:hypothetical protein [Caldilineales bacterium]
MTPGRASGDPRPAMLRWGHPCNRPDQQRQRRPPDLWLGGCWGRAHPNHAAGAGGAAYANMLSYVYPAIRQPIPRRRCCWAAWPAENWWDPPRSRGPFDPNFLDEVLAAGGGQYFDICSTTIPLSAGLPGVGQRAL